MRKAMCCLENADREKEIESDRKPKTPFSSPNCEVFIENV